MSAVTLNHRLSYQTIPASSSMRMVHLLINVDASGAPPIVAPMALGVVVDRSESMSLPMITAEQLEELRRSGKVRAVERDGVQVWEFRGLFPPAALRDAPRALDFVKQALRSVVEHLRNEDQFALIAFASKATTVLPLQSGHMRAEMVKALEQLEKLRLGDETMMAAGLALAYQQLQSVLIEPILHRMIVLTDGYVQDEERCRQWGARIAEAGVVITTIGIGASFNEDLMMHLADLTGGEAHLVLDPNDIPRIFDEELRQARMVAIRAATLSLQMARGVELRRAFRVQPSVAPIERHYQREHERRVDLPIGDVPARSTCQVLLELLLPPRPAGLYRIAQLQLHSEAMTGSGRSIAPPVNITVEYVDHPPTAPPDPVVMRAASIVSATELQTRALRDLATGDVGSGTRKLEAAKTRLLEAGATKQAQRADEILTGIAQQGSVSPEATKKLRYETRRLR